MTSPIAWPAIDPPHKTWVKQAKCANSDPRKFDPVGRPHKNRIAAKLCAGCPVIAQCAQDALHYQDEGIIRAATWIPSHSDGNAIMPTIIARLETIAGVRHEVAA